jgi:LPS-assembly protein
MFAGAAAARSLDNEFYKSAVRRSAGARRVAAGRATQKVPSLASTFPSMRPRLAPSLLAVCACWTPAAQAQDSGLALRPVPSLQPKPTGALPRQQGPLYLRADQLSGQPDGELRADGRVEMRRGGVVLRADQLRYDQAEDLAVAQGKVRITFEGSSFSGPEVQLKVQRMEGVVIEPEYMLAMTGAGGRAERIDILGPSTSRVINGDYTSCRRDGANKPDWILSARQLDLDTDAGVGVAEGAVLRFLDVPILALPRLSFPLSDQRKSGWLPPDLDFTTGSGAELAVPYYWNIAPNRDATLTPAFSTRRGFAVDGEFRYLEPGFSGRFNLDLLPYDQVYDGTRYWMTFDHLGRAGEDFRYAAHVERVSDDEWWNDFPRRHVALTPRLLPLVVEAEKDFGSPARGFELYARTLQWQILQAPNTMEAPFDRAAQFGLRSTGNLQAGLQYAIETEANRFVLPSNPGYSNAATPSNGSRLHAQGWINRPFREPGWWVTPSVLLNAASYYTDEAMPDGRTSSSRTIPTVSLGGGAEFQRSTDWLGRSLRQTLEPRLLYVYTPYVNQANYPNFDSAVKDYSFASIFSENVFSGIDRVSDTNALTAGVTTRLLDATSGAELLQLGIVQRYLFNDQLITETGVPENRGYSDVLLRGSTQVLQPFNLEGYLRYSPSVDRVVRTILGMQYAPGPFRTLNLTYRYARDISSQYEASWQWPIYQPGGTPQRKAWNGTANSCGGAWYTVGRLAYSTTDDRLTDSVVGIEYDAGCWIARMAVSRWSTGVSETSTQVLLQLELVGLSRLGTNAIGVLRDNIPGYQLLRDSRSATPGSAFYD